MPYDPQRAYQQIKDIEALCPLLAPRATVVIGTYNAAARTNKFSWAIPLLSYPPGAIRFLPIGPPPPPPPALQYRTANPQSILVTLRFEVVNLQKTLYISGLGAAGSASPGQPFVDLVLGANLLPGANLVSCDLVYGTVPQPSLEFVILQPPFGGAGAFTIPALPVGIIYAPPQPPAGSLSQYYSQFTESSSQSRSITSSVSTTNSTKTATAYTVPNFITQIASAIVSISSIASSIAAIVGAGAGGAATVSNWVKGISSFLNLLSGILNQTTTSTQTGLQITTTNQTTVTATETAATQTVPGPGQGPGEGDIFIILQNVRAVWIAVNGALSITVLGYDGQLEITADTLRAGTPLLDPDTAKALLQLDPFTGGAPYNLDPKRFEVASFPSSPLTLDAQKGALAGSYNVQYSVSEVDTTTSVQTQTTISDYKSGWLEALFGDNESVENTVTTAYTTTDSTTVGQSVSDQFYYKTATGEQYSVNFWYDRLFGTRAFSVPGQTRQTQGALRASDPRSTGLAGPITAQIPRRQT
jgi:hypothetical protein